MSHQRPERERGPAAHAAVATAALCAVLAAVLMAVGLAACGSDEAGGAPASPASAPPSDPGLSPEPVPGQAGGSPSGSSGAPVVYLLGGSSARECVVGNASWSAELGRLLGCTVRAVDLGATTQSYTADLRYVRAMDEGPALVVIGVGLGRYTSPPPPGLADKRLTPPLEQALAGELEVEHAYAEGQVKSDEDKERLLDLWLAERYPLFRRNYGANLAELERLLGECRQRGLRAVLLELPLNLEIVGDRLDAPRETVVQDSRRLATRFQIPFVSFVDELGLSNADFVDLMHLDAPARVEWQRRLSREVVRLLRTYDLAPG